MVKGEIKKDNRIASPDVNYRSIEKLNCSSIKIFEKKGINSFYKEVILKEKPKERLQDEEKSSLIIGNLFDFMRVDCEGDVQEFENRLDERFVLYNGIKSSSQEFLLADELYQLTVRDTSEEGIVGSTFESRFQEAFAELQRQEKFKGKTLEKALELFVAEPTADKLAKNPNLTSAEAYFAQKAANIGKQTVDLYHMEVAKRLLEQSIYDEFVKDVFTDDSKEIINKFVVEWVYSTVLSDDIQCKIEIDTSLWDWKTKTVYPKDVKTIFDNRREQIRRSYNSLLYGWQGAFYTLGLRWYLDNNGMDEWTIAPFEFIFFSTGNSNRPVKLEMDGALDAQAFNGYTEGDRRIRGLYTALEEIGWHLESGNWNVEKEAYFNGGYITIL